MTAKFVAKIMLSWSIMLKISCVTVKFLIRKKYRFYHKFFRLPRLVFSSVGKCSVNVVLLQLLL